MTRERGRSLAGVGPVGRAVERPGLAALWQWRRFPWDVTAIVLVALLFAALLVPAALQGPDDLELTGVLSTDEQLAGQTVRHMLDHRTLSPNHFFSYGALTSELAALLLLPRAAAGPVDDGAVLAALRLVALAGGMAAVLITGLLARRLLSGAAGIVAAALLAVTPELARWSITAHPDTVQLALLTASIGGCCLLAEWPSRRWVIITGSTAGLACAAKYGGLFVLPLAFVALLWGGLRQQWMSCGTVRGVSPQAGKADGAAPIRRRDVLETALLRFSLLCVLFALVFFLTNPYALVEPLRFLGQVRGEVVHVRAGHVFAMGDGNARWLTALVGRDLAGVLLALGAVVGAVVWWRERQQRVTAVLLTGWAVGYLLYLVLAVGYGAARYALPLLPVLCLTAAAGMPALVRGRTGRSRWWRALMVLVVVAVSLAERLPAAVAVVQQRQQLVRQLAADPRVEAGRWLGATAPASALVLRDAYTWLPPQLRPGVTTFGLTEWQIDGLRPHFIVVNEDIRGRFRWEVGAERYVDGPAAYHERMAAYAALEAGTLPCYALVLDLMVVWVYQRQC